MQFKICLESQSSNAYKFALKFEKKIVIELCFLKYIFLKLSSIVHL